MPPKPAHSALWARVLLTAMGLLSSAAFAADAPPPSAVIFTDGSTGPVIFAATELHKSLTALNHSVSYKTLDQIANDPSPLRFVLVVDSEQARQWLTQAGGRAVESLKPQGFALRKTVQDGVTTFRVIGADPPGAMYGGLQLAETIRLNKALDAVADMDAAPDILRRGVKFNVPLDARTPSYDDTGDSAQNNIETMWDLDFWHAYLDAMARNRYNVLTLWNPHPFPSMVKVPEYPDCALADVCISTLKPTFEGGKWADPQGVTPEILTNLKVIRPMTIDQKIDFWKKVMRYARDRGIDVYLVTWNVLVNSAAGKYGITDKQNNPITIDYLRASVRETVLTYPDLAGIGITAGENMQNGAGEFARERWLWRAYGEGILDAKRQQPDRKIELIHRHWNTQVADIVREWRNYPDTFSLSFKYARARLYSATRPPFADALVREMQPHGLKCWWNLRNDDIFVFRWGDPEYVREFLRNLPAGCTVGYYVGSDGYVWGREFVSTEPDNPRQLEIEKHWYSFMLWGRLGYDLHLPRTQLERLLTSRLPEAASAPLYDAWQAASKIIPLVNQFHWRDWDFMWSVEGCIDQQKGFRTVRDFVTTPTMQNSGMLPIAQYARLPATTRPAETAAITPPQVAQQLAEHARNALELGAQVRQAVPNPGKELRLTLGDIEAMAHLGNYYSAKILGATELALFDQRRDAAHKQAAIAHLQTAARHWAAYAKLASSQYRPQLLARTRELDWNKLYEDVLKDVETARSAP